MNSDNSTIAVLASALSLACVVIGIQWRYMVNQTVPYKLHKELQDVTKQLADVHNQKIDNLVSKVEVNIQQCRETNTLMKK